MSWLRMQDFVTFEVKGSENKKYLFECKDSASPTGHSLFVKLEATHSGIVNGNARFYRPDRMQDGCHTWTPKGRPARPILVNHNRDGECMGRIHKARYVDLSHEYNSEFPGVRGLCFYDSSPKKLNLYNSVDWVMRNLHGKPDYKGLGYIELDANILDPAAIEKVQDGRYMTVSVGFGTDAAVCSICHTDWAVDDRCDHELGHNYDGKPMFLISGNFVYKECSFVNFPADPWGAVANKDSLRQVADSVANRVFFMGLSPMEQQKRFVIDGKLALDSTDAINFLGSDIRPMEEDDEERTDMDLKAIQAEIRSKDLTKDRALALRAELEAAEDKDSVKRTLTSLIAKIRSNGWNEDASPTKETIEARIAGLDAHLATLAEADREAYLDSLETDAKVFGLDFKRPEAPEAPAPSPTKEGTEGTEGTDGTDGTGTTGGAPADAGDTKIKDAIDKVLGEAFPNANTDSDEGKASAAEKAKVLKCVNDMQAMFEGLTDETRYALRSCMGALLEMWSADNWLKYCKSRLESNGDAVVSQAELDELHTAVEKGEESYKVIVADKQALLVTNRSLIAGQKKIIAQAVVAGSVLLGKKGFAGLNADQIQSEIGVRAKRGLNSLEDSLADLLKEIPGTSQAATEPIPPEGAVRQVSDNAKVPDQEGAPTEDADGQVATEGEASPVLLTRLVDRQTAARLQARSRFNKRVSTPTNKE